MTEAVPVYTDIFVKFVVRDMRLDEIEHRYVEWLLGHGSRNKRDTRIKQGVRAEWTHEQLRCEATRVGTRGCSIDVRKTADSTLLRYIHRDGPDNDSERHSVVRLTKLSDGGTRVEHGLGRHFVGDGGKMPACALPSVLVALLDDSADIEPCELVAPLRRLERHEDVERFVAEHVFDPHRTVPIIVVSCDSDEGPPLILADSLSKFLRGLATVVELPTPDSTFWWGAAVSERDRRWRCFDGSVRYCGSTADPAIEDSTLWDGRTFRDPEVTPARATSRLATTISRRASWKLCERGFFGIVEEFDAGGAE